MYSDEDLDSAVTAGILSDDDAVAFRTHVAKLRRGPAVDEEHFRLVTGFNDVFVAIACLLLLGSVAWIGGAVVSWLGAAGVAGVAWILAEFFTRRRRMALPAIILLLAFVAGVLTAGLLLLPEATGSFLVAGALAAFAAWLHWLRFQVPITVAAGTAAVVGCTVALLLSAIPEAERWMTAIFLAAGIAVFLLAIRWDATDTARQTRRSDVAFWLHLLAAPLIVNPVFTLLGVFEGRTTTAQAAAVVLLYIAIAVVSLCIDRRALTVSALVYVLYTFNALLKQFGVVSLSFAVTALIIGSALLLLSAFWHPCRAWTLKFVPEALQRRLAPAR